MHAPNGPESSAHLKVELGSDDLNLKVGVRLRVLPEGPAVIVVCAAACGSHTSPVTVHQGSTLTVHQVAIYLGLSVRLQLDSPTVENDRIVVRA